MESTRVNNENNNDIDHAAILVINTENAKSELDDFAFMVANKLNARISSIGMPIGDRLTTLAMFNFNTDILVKYPA